MSFVEPSPHSRNRSQEPTSASVDRYPRRQSSQGRIALVWSREPATPNRASSAVTRFAVAAAARVAGYAGGDVLQMFFAVLSWIIREFLHGCAAYAQAMYPPIDPADRELKFAEYEAVKPAAPALPGRDSTIVAAKLRLTVAASNDQMITKRRSERQ